MKIYVFLLGFCAVLISSLGASFSVYGLASLFSGSFIAVAVMAGALEFGKLVIAAFLEANWKKVPFMIRGYLTVAVVTLMCITSMGIFGFLSNSYQTSSMDINRIQIQLASQQAEYDRAQGELTRMYKQIEDIPPDQSTKKLMLQKRFEPLIADYTKKSNDAMNSMSNLKLEQLQSHSKVGPLIYVAKAFNTEIDQVVKWLITLFVCVFDPLAICLVLATSTAIRLNAGENLVELTAKKKDEKDEGLAPQGAESSEGGGLAAAGEERFAA